jgi:hypothetical protein
MARATVRAAICGFDHAIEGKREGRVVIVDIDTPCEKIQKMSHMEVPIREIRDIRDNYVMNKAHEFGCSSHCLVPCGVMHVCRIEAGLLSGNLCKQTGGVSITFGDGQTLNRERF